MSAKFCCVWNDVSISLVSVLACHLSWVFPNYLRLCACLSLSVTQEVGNLMTEQNLAMILGPNILHKDMKVSEKETVMLERKCLCQQGKG